MITRDSFWAVSAVPFKTNVVPFFFGRV